MASVSVSGLHKRFGKTEVLRDVSLEVPDGAFAVLVGPSGCGKSTLLRVLAGLERADEGTVRFDDRDVTRLEPRERDIAMVFQSYALYPHLSVRENLAFGLKLRKTKAAETNKRVKEVSEMLGLDVLLDRMPRELSGGQRQRVAMGRAIVRRPALFMFDEPLSNLDAALRAQVRVDIRKLHQQLATTSVYVTHDQVEAMTLADVMFVLNKGRVEQAGAPLDVYNQPASRFVAGFLGSPSMNFLSARVVGDSLVIGEADDEQRLPLHAGVEDGRAVDMGLRPHDLMSCAAEDQGAMAVQVTLAEALGGETYVHGEIAGTALVVRLEASERVAVGDTIHVRAAAERVHLFDCETGKALR